MQIRNVLASTVVAGAVELDGGWAGGGVFWERMHIHQGSDRGDPRRFGLPHELDSVAAAHEKLCTYTTAGGAAAISITESPASGYPSVSLLKMMLKGASVATLKGIGSTAELARSKTQGLVDLYFVAGKNDYAVTLSDGHAKVSSKQISALESTSKTAAKKL